MIVALYWIAGLALFYSLVGYGLVLLLVARLAPRREAQGSAPMPESASILIAAYNESAVIEDKLANAAALERGDARVEVIVVDDGSSDGTADLARAADPEALVLEPGRVGKAEALARGLKACTGEIVVFSDANAMLAPGTLTAMLQRYTDPEVGGVCGQITIDDTDSGGIGRSEGMFWRYDQALKLAEAKLGGTVSAQGSVYSLRGSLARPPRPGCTDDFDISVAAVHAGKRLVFEPNATTTEITTEDVSSEMRRRVRSSERGWRSLMTNAALMNPFKHGLYAWQLFSHKLMRRLNPLFLVVLFATNLLLIGEGWFYTLTGLAQIAFYGMALLGLAVPRLRENRFIGLASFFTFAHAAMAKGILGAMSGKRSTLWTPARKEG